MNKNYQQFPGQSPCPNCEGHSIVIEEELFNKYFKQEEIICPNCKNKIDFWNFLLENIQTNMFFMGAISSIGAKFSLLQTELIPNTKREIILKEFGIPENAKILEINYSPLRGNLFPIEMHGNRPLRNITSNRFTLFPVPLDESKPVSNTNLSIFVTWIEHSVNDISWINLSKAFEIYASKQFDDKNYENIIIPANVAVESKLLLVLSSYLKEYLDKKKVDEFLSSAATYSYQLNILLPLFIKERKLYDLSDEIISGLNILRKFRNEFAHNGKIARRITQEEIGRILCCALFAFHYLRIISVTELGENK